MIEDYRFFEVADPFGQTWQVRFLWQQNAISIRHADAVDVKFLLTSGDTRLEKVVALMHPDLLALSSKAARPLTDSWVSRLAAIHLRRMIETGEDIEKTVVTPSLSELEMHHAALEQRASAIR